jgi:hemerythrin-like domain-containing protein
MLDRVKAMNCEDTVEFKAAVQELMNAVNVHVRDEENDMFARIKESFGDEQQKNLAIEFKKAKSEILDRRMAAAK